MSSGLIERAWNKLSPKTQEWLRANPGMVILPRNVTELVLQANAHPEGPAGVDRNGQLPLSPQDQAFIRSMSDASPVGRPVPPAAPSA
ncbi:hypothetical protein C8D78_0516 [Arthrobacter oryzae]|uniref:Uncharacterized protein n=1 Tax=Arthrobacter oryzae TaxID=409290 RepID=A0A495FP92_9MICC|nr:hypothetical protein C8D78_0516 [Arthrobacter oryzae]